ncbi:MAG: EAL domain-containing protein [Xanthobacteraceae bacterium]
MHFQELGLAMQISINIGVENLLSLPVVDIVSRYRPERNDSGGILLEITGRQFVSKGTALMPLLEKLREAGIPIAVDNFGVGAIYSTCSIKSDARK